MVSSRLRALLLLVAVAACSALLALGDSPATAAPAYDGQGYIDSTARCPSTAVLFGSTASSRVAICKSSDGSYQYRGVRVSDGAKLVTSATQAGSGTFTASNEGITYTVTSSTLTVTSGGQTLRSEPWVDFHGSSGTAPGTSTPSTTSNPSTATTSTGTSAAPSTTTVTATATPTVPAVPATPLPPPLPAEVGGGR